MSSSVEFDHVYDVVVVGSGGTGFATALGAIDAGLSVLIIESGEKWGGNTALSGGGMWLPNNPLMKRDKVADSRDEALEYMELTIGEEGRSTSRARKEAFVDGVEDWVLTAEKHGIEFARATDYPDYYPELPGGKIGRALEVRPHDSKAIGEWWDSIINPMAMPAMTDDVWEATRAWSSPGGVSRVMRIGGRVAKGVVRRQRVVGTGPALSVALLNAVVVNGGAPLWLNTSLTELIDDGSRIVGVRAEREGQPVTIGATRGVMLGAGGFESNQDLRRKYQGVEGHTSGADTNLGGPIDAAVAVGAATELLDDAWWGASSAAPKSVPGAKPGFIVGERSMPFSIMVDSAGKRFANESESYVDLGHNMMEHDLGGEYWMVTDRRHARRYLRMFDMVPEISKAVRKEGMIVKADSIAELARKIGVPAENLRQTIERFNGFARAGLDGDFQRGNTAYDRYYGDPGVHPNPNLGPLEKAPFYAYKMVLGDLGTKGGVVTDEYSRALREDGTVIEGLYSGGNNSASVMGRTYPGPGATIGPGTVFGLIAARHMAGPRN